MQDRRDEVIVSSLVVDGILVLLWDEQSPLFANVLDILLCDGSNVLFDRLDHNKESFCKHYIVWYQVDHIQDWNKLEELLLLVEAFIELRAEDETKKVEAGKEERNVLVDVVVWLEGRRQEIDDFCMKLDVIGVKEREKKEGGREREEGRTETPGERVGGLGFAFRVWIYGSWA